MILPGEVTFQGVIGTTFDAVLTVYSIETPLSWQEPLLWGPSTRYVQHAAVVASNGSAYESLVENENVYPVGDLTGHWKLIEPVNITGWAAEFKLKTVTLKSGSGLTLGGVLGTIAIEMTATETSALSVASEHFSLLLTLPSTKKYEYLKGTLNWVAQ